MGMGYITSGGVTIELDNDVLLHLQAAIELRFRADEHAGFFVGIAREDEGPISHTLVWVSRNVPLSFDYTVEESIKFDATRAAEYAEATTAPFGFYLGAANRPPLVDREQGA